ADLFNHLQSRVENLRLMILDKNMLSDITKLKELLQAFLCARTVIAMHGSELVLSMLMAPSATIVELFPYGVEPAHYTPFRTLATILGHQYYAWKNELKHNGIFHGEHYPAEWGGLSHLSTEERQSIEQSVD